MLGSAYAESLDMGNVGCGLLVLTLHHNDAWNTKHGYKSVVRMVPFEIFQEVAVNNRFD